MDKNVIKFILLSGIVLVVTMFYNSYYAPPPPQAETVQQAEQTSQTSPAATGEYGGVTDNQGAASAVTGIEAQAVSDTARNIVFQNEVFEITFNTRGATVNSIKLLQHLANDGQPVELLFSGDSSRGAFATYWGGINGRLMDAVFAVNQGQNNDKIEFSAVYQLKSADGSYKNITVVKRFNFNSADSYLFSLEIELNSEDNLPLPVDIEGLLYTVGFEPQLGPEFAELSGNYVYRHFYAYQNSEAGQLSVDDATSETLADRASWTGIAGKYFVAVGLPASLDDRITLSRLPEQGLPAAHKFYFSQPSIGKSDYSRRYHFYVGPRLTSELALYNDAADNAYGLSDLNMDALAANSSLLWPLIWVFERMLKFFYSLIPNYGVAIIMLTIVVKLFLFPFTKKSYQSTARMQKLAPQLKELQEKHKGNPQKLNKEMAALYKREKVNPLGGCLPILFQLPIFFSIYNLLNSNFEFRGASFFGWINDLSSPESIYTFSSFSIPFLGPDIRLLPIFFVVVQILYSKLMQNPGAAGNKQAKMMMYMLPLVFFFFFYSAPSGLLVYWISSMGMTIVQQYYYNKHIKDKVK